VALAEKRLAALGAPPALARTRTVTRIELAREGELWRVSSSTGATMLLEDRKGLAYLERLLSKPNVELHVSELAELGEPAGDAGVVLDARAKNEYRRRVEAL